MPSGAGWVGAEVSLMGQYLPEGIILPRRFKYFVIHDCLLLQWKTNVQRPLEDITKSIEENSRRVLQVCEVFVGGEEQF